MLMRRLCLMRVGFASEYLAHLNITPDIRRPDDIPASSVSDFPGGGIESKMPILLSALDTLKKRCRLNVLSVRYIDAG
jgi:hypothetical protein